LISPQNAAVDLSVTPTLTWSTVAGASTYEVQVSTAKDMTSVVVDDATSTTGTKTLSVLLNSTTYYWRVQARSLSGLSNWTDPWSFTTIVTTPATPTLVLPNDNAVNQSVSLNLAWNTTTGSASYFVQVASDTGFTSVVSSDSSVADTTKAISGLQNSVTYYWKVKGKNVSGYGKWSAYRTFTTVVATPATPVLAAPLDGVTNVDLNMQLSWNPVTWAATYHIQVSMAADFSTGIIVDDSTYTQTTKPIGPLSASTPYYWRVQAKNAGGTSSWSPARSFVTVPAKPSAPALVSPPDAATGQPDSLTLTWNKAAGASSYYVNVATDTGFSAIVKTDSTVSLTDTSKVVAGLTSGTAYYWRVQAKNAGGASPLSVRRSFTTISQFTISTTAVNGSVTSAPTFAKYDSGMVVLLTAVPAAGYSFTSWSGDLAGTTNPQNITVNAAKNVTANFEINTYQLTTTAGPGGSISAPTGSPVIVNYGATTTITASPYAGYDFTQWTITSGSATITDANSASTAVALTSGDATVKANFAIRTYLLTVNAGTGGTITAPSNSPVTVIYGGATTVKASPSPGYAFTYWSVVSGSATFNNADTPSTTVTLTAGNTTVQANFKPLCQWTAVNTGLTDNTSFSLAVNGGNIFAGTTIGVFLSTNNGTNWAPVQTGMPAEQVYSLAVSGSNIFAGTGGGVFLSSNNGTSWTAIDSGLTDIGIFSIAVSGSNILAGTATSGVFLSSNNGTSWKRADTGITTKRVQAIAVIGNNIFAGTYGGGVFLSTDNCATWSPVNSGLANTTIMSLAVKGDSLFAGTSSGGVFLSTNNGTSWTAVNSGLTGGQIILSLATIGNDIFAGTGGDGVFLSTNNGASWTAVNSGLSTYNIYSFAIIGNSILAGTYGGGVFISPMP
jgi:hypothetical protein